MEFLTTLLLTTFVALLVQLWRIAQKAHRYWDELGIKTTHKAPLVGSSWPMLTQKVSQGEFYTNIYREFPDERFAGLYNFLTPVLMVRDPLVVERIMIKEFSHFPDRGLEDTLSEIHPIDQGLFLLKGDRWRAMRVKLTPVFTSAKIKTMFEIAAGCAENLTRNITQGSKDYLVKDLMSVFSCDVVASCVFGLDIGSQLSADSEFVQRARRVFSMSTVRLLKFFLTANFPWTRRYIGISMTAPDVADYFWNLLERVLKERRLNPVERNDFIRLLLLLREKGTLKVQTSDPDDQYLGIGEVQPPTEYEEEVTDATIIAQAYAFLSAGFDSTSTLLEYILYELARHPKAQEKAREEVLKLLEEEGGNLSYQTLAKMVYLEKCVKETLRLYPPAAHLFRICAKEYVLEDGLVIKPGQQLILPIQGIQTDPQYFPEPMSFIPERFDEEPPRATYIPFGVGPRMCIGMRFAMVNVKLGLATILKAVKIEPSPKTIEPLVSDPCSMINCPKNNVWCRLTKL